ncbi:MAG: hypothetical protein AAFY17_04370, partial [Cyanobacteria bacterium J06642_11]
VLKKWRLPKSTHILEKVSSHYCLAFMNSDHQSREEDLKKREAAIREREIKIRMRELESELEESTPVQPTVKHKAAGSISRPWYRRLPTVVKFGMIVGGVIIATQLATWVAGALILFGIGWAGYKLFLERDRS